MKKAVNSLNNVLGNEILHFKPYGPLTIIYLHRNGALSQKKLVFVSPDWSLLMFDLPCTLGNVKSVGAIQSYLNFFHFSAAWLRIFMKLPIWTKITAW